MTRFAILFLTTSAASVAAFSPAATSSMTAGPVSASVGFQSNTCVFQAQLWATPDGQESNPRKAETELFGESPQHQSDFLKAATMFSGIVNKNQAGFEQDTEERSVGYF